MIPGRASVLALVAAALFATGCPNGAGLTCPNGQTFCGGRCIFVDNDPANCGGCGMACPGMLACIAGSCGCPQPLSNCGDVCVDENVDGNNCGGCGAACVSGMVCSGGSCAVTCGANLSQCGQSCVDTTIDPNHCGGCNVVCDPTMGQICCDSACVPAGTPDHCVGCAACPNGMVCDDFSGMSLMCGPPG
ncbi:MAG TPA: MXAN_6577-like cysteine-rich protein [Polyangia bacterium]